MALRSKISFQVNFEKRINFFINRAEYKNKYRKHDWVSGNH